MLLSGSITRTAPSLLPVSRSMHGGCGANARAAPSLLPVSRDSMHSGCGASEGVVKPCDNPGVKPCQAAASADESC